MVGGRRREKLFTSWQAGNWEKERTWRQDMYFKGLPPLTDFLHLDSIHNSLSATNSSVDKVSAIGLITSR